MLRPFRLIEDLDSPQTILHIIEVKPVINRHRAYFPTVFCPMT